MEKMMKSVCAAYQPRLYRYGLSLTSGNVGLAEDALQDALLKVWRSCLLFSSQSLLPWAMSILRNATFDLLDVRRRQAAEPLETADGAMRTDVELALLEGAVDTSSRPDSELERAQGMRLLLACMARFERDYPDHAQALRCAIYESSGEEMATILGRTPHATRELLYTARIKARTYFAEWYAWARRRAVE